MLQLANTDLPRTTLGNAGIGAPQDVSHAQKQEPYYRFFMLAGDPMCIADPFGRFLQVNPAMQELTGYSEAELLSRPFLDFVIPEDRERTATEMRQQVETRPSLHFINRYVCKTGRVVRLSWNAYFDHRDGVTYATARDITLQTETQSTLKRNFELLDRLFDTAHFCLVYLDRNFNFLRVNKAFADVCGHTPDYFVGRNHFSLYPSTETEALFRYASESGKAVTLHAKPFALSDHPEDSATFWDWTLHPVKDELGQVEGLLFVLVDVTQQRSAQEQIRNNEARLRLALKGVDMALFHQDRDLRYTWIYSPHLGYTPGEVIGKTDADLLPSECLALVTELKRRVLQSGNGERAIIEIPLHDQKHYFDLKVEPLVDAFHTIVGVTGASLDVTDRMHAERARAQLASIVESSNDAILLCGLDRVILAWNRAAERLFGWSAREAVGQSIDSMVALPEHTEVLSARSCNQVQYLFDTTHLHRDGTRIATQTTVSPVRDATGCIMAHSHVVRDMRALKAKEETVRQLSQRLRQVEESERRAIARELHDRIGQDLSTVGLLLASLKARLPTAVRLKMDKPLQDIQALLKTMVANVRDIMAELRPPVLEDYGLLAALRQLASDFTRRTGIACDLVGEDLQPRLQPEMETTMYRISQEVLNNVAKHARARRVSLRLRTMPGHVALEISDDGIGFEPGRISESRLHWGLSGMRERAAHADIGFALESKPGRGTQVLLQVKRPSP